MDGRRRVLEACPKLEEGRTVGERIGGGRGVVGEVGCEDNWGWPKGPMDASLSMSRTGRMKVSVSVVLAAEAKGCIRPDG